MESQPPNDPNNNNNNHDNNHQGRAKAKEAPYDGRNRRNGDANGAQDGMDVMGDMRDAPAVFVMFFVGVAAWFLKERCAC